VIRVFAVARTAAGRLALQRGLDGPEIEVVGTGPAPQAVPPGVDVLVLGDEALLAGVGAWPPGTGGWPSGPGAWLPGPGAAPAVVVLADGARVRAALRRLRPRGWAVVTPAAGGAELRAAVAAAAHGFVALPAGLADGPGAGGTVEPEPLTPREREVLDLLGQGLSNRRIAARLGISEHTAKFHVGSVLAKLGVSSRTEAVSLGIRRGLITV
jgi:DNA-binding CsgD family transcriptional regulator